MKQILILSSLCIILINCTNKKTSIYNSSTIQIIKKEDSIFTIDKPIKSLEIKPIITHLKAEKNETINFPSGSKIEIQKNSLVDKNGNIVKGEYTIEWNEYHTLSEILLSGLPMSYDSLNQSYNLTSGGMFEIKAYKKDEPLYLAKGKSIIVDIASIEDTPCMNFYKLDKKTGKWDYKLTKSGIPKKVEKSDSIPPSFLDLQLPLDSFPELKNKNVIGWKTVYPISKMENSLLNKSDNMYTLSKTTETNYNLKVTNGRIIKNFLVTPFTIQDAKNQSKVVEHKILKNYLSLLEFQNKMEKKPFVRTVSIQGFGVYNWDIINKSNRIKVFAKVTLPKNISKKKINYFLITPEDKTLVRYEENTLNMFGLPKNKSCFIAILPDNSLYVCNSKKFQNLKVIKNTVYIDLVKSDINISTSSDLTASLKSLF